MPAEAGEEGGLQGTRADLFLDTYVHANSPMRHEGRFLGVATVPLLEAAGFRVLVDEELSVPWRFAHAEEAGAFGADLFGIDGPGADEVAEALGDIVGTSADAAGFRVDWSLRRLICRAR